MYNYSGSIEDLSNVAIAAVYEEDKSWYRARIITSELTDDLTHLLVEFVDYGNRQLEPIEKCVLLSEKLANFKPSAIKCNGVAYLENFKNTKLLENLIQIFTATNSEKKEEQIPFEWKQVYFVKNKNDYLIEIDQLYKYMYETNLVEKSFLFNPFTLNEAICKQVKPNDKEEVHSPSSTNAALNSTIYHAIVTDLSNGLKYIHLNLKQALGSLDKLNKELATENAETLIRLNLAELSVNSYYLVKHDNQLRRCILLTPAQKNMGRYRIQLLDTGKRVSFIENDDMEFYVMMTKYFKYSTFALHCRLPLANSIEKVWLEVKFL